MEKWGKKSVCVSVCLHLLNSFNMGEVISSAGPVCAFQIAIQLFKLMNVFITNNVIRCSMFQQLFDILISSFHFFSVSPRSYCNCKVIFTKIYSSRNRVEQHYHAASFPFFCSLELMPILWLLLELFPLDMPFKCGLHVSWPYCRVSPIMVVRIFCNISVHIYECLFMFALTPRISWPLFHREDWILYPLSRLYALWISGQGLPGNVLSN